MDILCYLLHYLSGFLYSISDSYQVAFYVAGAVPTLAACLMFAIPFLMPPPEHIYWKRQDTITKREQSDGRLLSPEPGTSSGKPPSRPPVTRNVPRIALSQSVNSLHKYFDMPKRVSMAEIGSVTSLAIIPRNSVSSLAMSQSDRASVV